jgi:CheY-like chemotaxis protein
MPNALIVAYDPTVAEVLRILLAGEGYQATAISDTTPAMVRKTVTQYEPDFVLLDDHGMLDYDASWETAAWLRRRPRPVPTVMLTSHPDSADEARMGHTPRSQAAAFAGVLAKPFDLDDVLVAVDRAMSPLRLPAGASNVLTR